MCEHNAGWIISVGSEIVLTEDGDGSYEAELECNLVGCEFRKKFKFRITDLEAV